MEKTISTNIFLIKKIINFQKKIIFIMVSLFMSYWFERKYRFCLKCIHDNNVENLDSKCDSCSNELVFRDYHFETTDNTLNEILTHNKSISRFSDGEFKFIFKNLIISF